jgi:hypothetical protein
MFLLPVMGKPYRERFETVRIFREAGEDEKTGEILLSPLPYPWGKCFFRD